MNVSITALLGIGAIIGGSVTTAYGADAPITVAVQGVRIIKPLLEGSDDLRAFGEPPGATVALLLTAPDGGLVLFDGDSSHVTSCVDDKGKDLTNPEPGGEVDGEPEIPNFGPFPTFRNDGRHCSLELSVPGVPTKGASVLTVSGKVVVKVAKRKKDFAAETVALKVGTVIDAGPIPLRIKRAGQPQWGGNEPLGVMFEAKQNLDSIATIRFFEGTGKEIEAKEVSRNHGRLSPGDVVTAVLGNHSDHATTKPAWSFSAIEYRLKTKVDSAKVVITYWSDMKPVAVPFDLTVGLGL
jgi:hypothetical protein